MNKYLIKLQLPITALLIIFLVYGFLTLRDLGSKTNDLKKQNQNLTLSLNQTTSDLASLKNNVSTTQDQLASAQKQIVLPAQTSKQTASSTLTATPTVATKTITQTVTQQIVPNQATVTIDGIGKYQVDLQASDTAFDILKRASEQNNFALNYSTDPTFGAFITGIGNTTLTSNQFWCFYYNGNSSQVGVSSQSVSKGDLIEFRIESW